MVVRFTALETGYDTVQESQTKSQRALILPRNPWVKNFLEQSDGGENAIVDKVGKLHGKPFRLGLHLAN